MKVTKKLRAMLDDEKIHIAPGIYDGLTARIADQAGFGLLYASGGAIARSCGIPDIGLLSFSEVLQRLSQMVEVTSLPIIADADTGFGNEVNANRTIRSYERAGIAGLHIEDQTYPKRCGHLDDKSVIPTAEMVSKLSAMVDAREDPDFLIIARTDAIATEGFSAAIDRSHAYIEAGADVIFVEAPETIEQIEQIAELIPAPKLINMFISGKTPLVERSRLQELGYKIILIPSDVQRAAIHSSRLVLESILMNGDTSSMQEGMVSFSDRELIVKTADYLSI